MTDTQHGKPDKEDRKSIKHNRLADEHSNIAAANAQGGELTSSEQGGNTDEHEGITETIPNTQSGVTGICVSQGCVFPAHISLGTRVSPHTYH